VALEEVPTNELESVYHHHDEYFHNTLLRKGDFLKKKTFPVSVDEYKFWQTCRQYSVSVSIPKRLPRNVTMVLDRYKLTSIKLIKIKLE
jgi:hypothetical protein